MKGTHPANQQSSAFIRKLPKNSYFKKITTLFTLRQVLQGYKNTTENQRKTDTTQNKTHKTLQAGHTHTLNSSQPSQVPPEPQKKPQEHPRLVADVHFQEQHWQGGKKRRHHVPPSLVALLVLGDFVRQSPLPQVLQVPHDGSSLQQSLNGAFEHGSCLRLGEKRKKSEKLIEILLLLCGRKDSGAANQGDKVEALGREFLLLSRISCHF